MALIRLDEEQVNLVMSLLYNRIQILKEAVQEQIDSEEPREFVIKYFSEGLEEVQEIFEVFAERRNDL